MLFRSLLAASPGACIGGQAWGLGGVFAPPFCSHTQRTKLVGLSRNVNQGPVQEIETALVIASVTLFQHRALVKPGMRTEARTHTENELWQLQAGGEDGRCDAQTWGLEEAPGVLGPVLAVWGC